MRILCVGGGSGGHVTPVAAVIKELQKQQPDSEIRFYCDRSFKQQSIELIGPLNVKISVVVSGKWRRYANMKWYWHFEHLFKTHFRNLIDIFKVGFGLVESYTKMLVWRPDVVFAKGGFVCLPVGLAAKALSIPIVIHDSDTYPGLTDRILSRYAAAIATGMPTEYYPSYPKNITEFVGIPVRAKFYDVATVDRAVLKQQLGFNSQKTLVVAMGGGQGAEEINQAMITLRGKLEQTQILLITGQKNYQTLSNKYPDNDDWRLAGFLGDEMAAVMRAADIVVTRAGATTLAELAVIGAVVVLLPSPYLSGDHQTKNAKIYADKKAAVVLDERDFDEEYSQMLVAIEQLINQPSLRHELANNLQALASPDSVQKIAKLILEAANVKAR
jgi:UDP-N-acetylglucosamine--N-acetylmuramyl-(pentapeptide) pyrophosphoryl-undecaprenol N-acetylglucosamine transferase